MHNIKTLEKYFRKYLKNLDEISEENFVYVDLNTLYTLDLLQFHHIKTFDAGLTRYFQVIETPDKITLVNDDFVVWIIPENIEDKSLTYVMIATNGEKEPKLELVFLLAGVYSTPHLILSVLDKFLFEIQENEELLQKLQV